MSRLGIPFADPAILQGLLGGVSGQPIAQGAGGLEALIGAFMAGGQFAMPGNPLLDYAMANPEIRALLQQSTEFAPSVAQRDLQQQMQPRPRATPQTVAWDRMSNAQLYSASRMPDFAQGALKEAHRRGVTMGNLHKQYGAPKK